ncbi:MAG: hypothetical protein ABI337_08320 [Nitrososphaera sp.]
MPKRALPSRPHHSITVRKNIQEIKLESIIEINRNRRNTTISTPQQPRSGGLRTKN